MVQSADDAQFVIERLVTVKLEVLVGVGGIPVHGKRQLPVAVPGGFGVKHGQGSFLFLLLCEL